MTVRIAVDCMGGDHGLPVTVPALIAFAKMRPDALLLLVGLPDQIEPKLGAAGAIRERLELVPASEVVAMDDPVAIALRSKRDSSMRVAINLVKDGGADAAVSAGNTGALMAISRFVLKTLEGIDRPAIATALPNEKGGVTTVLDLGANVDCSAEHLLQFALLGAALVSAIDERERPTVGLLNIGEEVVKGNEVVKQAAELLRASGLDFRGNVEGDDIFRGTTDVVVCDGFVGNVLLKTAEGLAQMLVKMAREEFARNALAKALALLSYPVLNRFKHRVDHRRHNGANLLGLRGVVIKSHGSADALAFRYALDRAYEMVRHRVLERTIAAMQPLLPQLRATEQDARAEASPPAVSAVAGAAG